jgi:hypothetical protein
LSTIEELLEKESRGSGLENREYGRIDPRSYYYYYYFIISGVHQLFPFTEPTKINRSTEVKTI